MGSISTHIGRTLQRAPMSNEEHEAIDLDQFLDLAMNFARLEINRSVEIGLKRAKAHMIEKLHKDYLKPVDADNVVHISRHNYEQD